MHFQCICMVNSMSEVNIKTQEKSTEIPRFAYGGFWIRFLAYLIDSVVITSIAQILNGLIFSRLDISLPFSLGMYETLRWVIFFLYYFLTSFLNKGQSLGKMIVGIRVVSLTDEKLSTFQVLTREVFGRYIEEKIKILYIIVAFTPMKQSLADIFSDTVVIKNDVVDYFFEN